MGNEMGNGHGQRWHKFANLPAFFGPMGIAYEVHFEFGENEEVALDRAETEALVGVLEQMSEVSVSLTAQLKRERRASPVAPEEAGVLLGAVHTLVQRARVTPGIRRLQYVLRARRDPEGRR